MIMLLSTNTCQSSPCGMRSEGELFPGSPTQAELQPELPGIAIPDEIETALTLNAPVAIGVSGGKDSTIAAHQTVLYLRNRGYTGTILLIHSDLGRVEWKDSLPVCERLAEQLGIELVVLRRKAGDMMDRWLKRWENNCLRYQKLECVRLILPWSTPSMRFCTSELKTHVISSYLKKRFPGQTILNVTGVRAQESTERAKKPVSSPMKALTAKTKGTTGYEWNPILGWTLDQVWQAHHQFGLPIHEAYTRYGSTRVSCAFCIMARQSDLRAAADCVDNVALYREMVRLESTSTFGFQSGGWLGDVAPHLLSPAERKALYEAKERAERRIQLEKQIPRHMLYKKGWPTQMPTFAEAALLARIRREVGELIGIRVDFTTPETIQQRYSELLALKRKKGQTDSETTTQTLQLSLF